LYHEEVQTTGEVSVSGQSLRSLAPKQVPFFRRKMGVVFQDFGLLPNKTIFENVAFALRVIGAGRREIRKKVPAALDMVGLTRRCDAFPNQLSGGEQQRVAIARALCTEPSVLLADEPTGNLDPHTGANVFNHLRTLAKHHGMACVVATHNESLAGACDRIVQLCEGTLREVTFSSDGAGNRDRPVPGPTA